VLLLDPSGRVKLASAAALQLWQVSEGELGGAAFAGLFAFEVVSEDPEFLEAQWEALQASALDEPATLNVQPRGGNPREMRVQLERLSGEAGGFLATVRSVLASAAGASQSGAATGGADALGLLEEAGGVGLFELDLRQHNVRLTPAWKKQLGYAVSEIQDTLDAWLELIHPDDSAAAPTRLGRKPVAGTRAFNVEFRMRHQRGHWLWVQCLGVQVVGPGGELERVTGLQLDIAERKEMEDSLVANDARLQDLSSAGPLAAFELDFSNRVF